MNGTTRWHSQSGIESCRQRWPYASVFQFSLCYRRFSHQFFLKPSPDARHSETKQIWTSRPARNWQWYTPRNASRTSLNAGRCSALAHSLPLPVKSSDCGSRSKQRQPKQRYEMKDWQSSVSRSRQSEPNWTPGKHMPRRHLLIPDTISARCLEAPHPHPRPQEAHTVLPAPSVYGALHHRSRSPLCWHSSNRHSSNRICRHSSNRPRTNAATMSDDATNKSSAKGINAAKTATRRSRGKRASKSALPARSSHCRPGSNKSFDSLPPISSDAEHCRPVLSPMARGVYIQGQYCRHAA